MAAPCPPPSMSALNVSRFRPPSLLGVVALHAVAVKNGAPAWSSWGTEPERDRPSQPARRDRGRIGQTSWKNAPAITDERLRACRIIPTDLVQGSLARNRPRPPTLEWGSAKRRRTSRKSANTRVDFNSRLPCFAIHHPWVADVPMIAAASSGCWRRFSASIRRVITPRRAG